MTNLEAHQRVTRSTRARLDPASMWQYLALAWFLTCGYLTVFYIQEEAAGYISASAVLLPFLALAVSGRLVVPAPLASFVLLVIFVMCISTFVNSTSLGLFAASCKVIFIPVCAYLVAYSWPQNRYLRRWDHLLTVLMVINLGFALWQAAAGTESLIEYGYTYGNNLRNFSGEIRAFGLLPRDNIFGQIAAVFLILSVWAMLRRLPGRYTSLPLLALVSVACLVLSLNRTALALGLAGSLIVLLLYRSGAARLGKKILLSAIPGAAILYTLWYSDVGTTDSLSARLNIWNGLLEKSHFLVGGGPGSAGVAATSQLAGGGQIVSVGDNYYITVFSQFGLLGLIPFALVGFYLFRAIWHASHAARSLLVALSFFALVGMITDNMWEEFPTAVIVATIAGVTIRLDRDGVFDAPWGKHPLQRSSSDWSTAVRDARGEAPR